MKELIFETRTMGRSEIAEEEPRIALLRPSRGLLFSESEDSCWRELRYFEYERLPVHDKPIPDCFNYLVAQFLETDSSHALFVEEDVVLPEGAIGAMIALDADISAVNYRLKTDARFSEMRYQGKLMWVSLGCTMVKRKVFETLPRPWFSTDYALSLISTGSACKEKFWDLQYSPRQYAGQDSYFSFTALKAGFTIGVVPDMLCDHLKLDALGEPNANNGCHRISRVK
jgi:hypothetical protein